MCVSSLFSIPFHSIPWRRGVENWGNITTLLYIQPPPRLVEEASRFTRFPLVKTSPQTGRPFIWLRPLFFFSYCGLKFSPLLRNSTPTKERKKKLSCVPSVALDSPFVCFSQVVVGRERYKNKIHDATKNPWRVQPDLTDGECRYRNAELHKQINNPQDLSKRKIDNDLILFLIFMGRVLILLNISTVGKSSPFAF